MDGETEAAGASSPHLDDQEQSQAASHAAPRALVIHEIIREEGETALARTNGALLLSGLAAGLSMGFSFLAQGLLQARLEGASAELVGSLGYSVGFVLVILGRQQLFTESTLTVVLPVLTRRDLATLLSALRLWMLVLMANLVGTAIFAALLLPDGVFSPEVMAALHALAGKPMQAPFWSTVLRAVFAGWLIALMVWILPSARSGRLLTVLVVTYVVGLGGLAHIIAGSAESLYAVFSGQASAGDFLLRFLLPTFIGNTLGGIALVGLLNHGAIAPEIHPVRPG